MTHKGNIKVIDMTTENEYSLIKNLERIKHKKFETQEQCLSEIITALD